MFSVLWKRNDGYEEAIPDVAKVWKTPITRDVETETQMGTEVGIVVGIRLKDPDTGEDRFFEEGSIYAMNENGRTVATYYPKRIVEPRDSIN